MSENIFEPLVNAVIDVIGVTFLNSCKYLGMKFNNYDFERFFKGANIKNHANEIPKFLKWDTKENYDVYFFSIPWGLEIIDFKKEVGSLASFLGIDESLLEIRLAENLKDTELRVFQKRNVQKYNFYKFFYDVELKNIREDYPRMKLYSDEKFYEKYVFNVPNGLSINDFRQKLNSLALFLGIKEDYLRFEINENLKDVELRILKEFGEIDFSMVDLNINLDKEDFRIPIGVDINTNQILYLDILDYGNWHCYLGGTTGSGKSNQLRVMITYLIAMKNCRDVEFAMINTKRLDLKEFRDAIHTKNFSHGKEDALVVIENVVEEMRERYIMLDNLDCEDWKELRVNKRLPYKILIIEEINDYKSFKKFHNCLELLLTQGRSVGILVYLTTQLPSIEALSSVSKQCFNTTIAQKCKDLIRASIIIDDENANLNKLRGKGHSKIYSSNSDGVEFQAFKISKKQIQEVLNANKVKSS